MKFCPECGAALGEGVKFCTECGAKIVVPEPVYEEPVPVPEPVYVPPVLQEEPKPVYEEPVVEEPVPVPEPVYVPPVLQEEKKPKKKKKIWPFIIVGAVVVAALLLIVLLGGGKKDVYFSGDDWIELKQGGKATIFVMDTEFKASWEQIGDVLVVEQNGDTYMGTCRDGVVTLDLAGTTYVFSKEAEGAVTYKAVSCISGGQILDEGLMDSIGGVYVRLRADGTGTFYCFGDKAEFTYDKKTMKMGGEEMPYTVSGDTMEFTYVDGSAFTLQETQADPEAAGVVTNGWEEPKMSEDVLRYLDWPGQDVSELELDGAWLEVEGDGYSGAVYLDGTRVEGFHLFIDGASYEELHAMLTERCGEATDEGEEPYAEANGGAVTYSWFQYKTGTIRLSSASERDYVEIEMTPG